MSAPGEPTLAVPVSPPGRGAVALIHVSGAQARAVVERLLESGRLPAPDRARHAWLVDAAGERLDDALLVTEDAGTAFTGLPLVELGIHGGPAVRDAVLRALEQAGARPGDWKALLAQAWRTGARDAICLAAHRRLARTDSRAGTAILVRALNGELQARVRGVLERGDPGELRAFAEASRRASVWFRPLRVVLIGPPNAGKSTLFNALLGWERATVSGEAGTTRDSVEEDILLDDRPVRLVDTAGGRSEAVAGARIRDREVRIHVVDATARPGPGAELPDEGGRGGSLVPVANKVDRLDPGERRRLPPGRLAVSALSGEGLEALAAAVFGAADGSPARPASEVGSEPVLFTRRDLRLLEAVTGPDAVAGRAREELRARTRPRRSARA